MFYTLIIICLSTSEAEYDYNQMVRRMRHYPGIKTSKTNRTIETDEECIIFKSFKSSFEKVTCKEYQFSDGVSRKIENITAIRDTVNKVRRW